MGLNENISTYGPIGSDYLEGELSLWESSVDRDLVTEEVTEVLEVYLNTGETFTEYNDFLNQSGGTFSADYHLEVRAAAGHAHNGVPNTGVSIKRLSSGACWTLRNPFFVSKDLILENGGGVINQGNAVSILASDHIYENIISINRNMGVGSVFSTTSGQVNVKYINCIAIGDNVSSGIAMFRGTAGGLTYNCHAWSINGAGVGFEGSSSRIAINNTAQNITTGFSGTFHGDSDYNISSSVAPPGANSSVATLTYIDSANLDFNPVNGEPNIDSGLDLSSDPTYPFNFDIARNTRIGTWEIGPFRFVDEATLPASSGPIIFWPRDENNRPVPFSIM